MSQIVPIVPVEGNISTSPAKVTKANKQISPSKKWVFTDWLKNKDKDNYSSIEEMISSIRSRLTNISHLSFQIEKCETSGKIHAQGSVIFLSKVRPLEYLSKICYWKKMKGTWQQCLEYTSKGYTKVCDGYMYPEPPPKYALNKVHINDFEEWQQDALDIMMGDPMPRKVHWYYSDKGNLRKSYFGTHCLDNLNKKVMIFDDTTKSHVHYAFCGSKDGMEKILKNEYMFPDIVIFDLPRAVTEDKVDYKTIESILDQRFLNTKFESKMVRFNQPHVFVFANFRPDTSNKHMSNDRFIICCLDGNEDEDKILRKRIIKPIKNLI